MPAVTKVDECTSEEIGVGAHIARGSHEEKGTRADLVIPAKQSRAKEWNDKEPERMECERARKKKQSPKRFVRPVMRPPRSETRERNITTNHRELKPNKSQATKAEHRDPEKMSKNIENRKENKQPQKYL